MTGLTDGAALPDGGDAPERYTADVLVIGSGIAGCAAALAAAREGADVLVATKAERPEDAATDWAQGGIAVTQSDPEAFAADIRAAGAGETDPEAVEVLVENAREAVDDVLLDTLDVDFDTTGDDEDAPLDLGREAAHSERRILHVDAETGRHVLRPFLGHLEAHDGVELLADTAAYDLLTHEGRVHGALLETTDEERSAVPAYAGATVVATGGIGSLYRDSTNPDGATGDGIAMAALAGADVADAQYVQFHPTVFDTAAVDGDAEPFLVSEAVRGEGGVLRDGDGERFMTEVHEDAELAPRDVVARAVADAREATGEVRLDVSAVDFAEEFPGLAEKCEARGVDPADGIPVAPAEHFLCGGIDVDTRGRASLDRLFAAGECARTGVHGANRLASTSLLEGLVWGLRAGETAAGFEPEPSAVDAPEPRDSDPALPENFAHGKFHRLRDVMTDAFGLERDRESMRRASAVLRRLKGEVDAYTRTRTSRSLYELRNASVTALLIAKAAVEAEPAGTHHVVDATGETDADGGDRGDEAGSDGDEAERAAGTPER
ncbi:L-aspartate oxidase [Halobaculum sp. MBLA0147]|uniref:L-aspartate oxidase n=1 Tax=Halobaculum sp. MBLA0147 TaxID=3079934 RepID=UPI003525AED2